MRYRLWTLRFFVHESLKRDNKEENYERKKCKVMKNNEKSPLRCCCVFQVIIF